MLFRTLFYLNSLKYYIGLLFAVAFVAKVNLFTVFVGENAPRHTQPLNTSTGQQAASFISSRSGETIVFVLLLDAIIFVELSAQLV